MLKHVFVCLIVFLPFLLLAIVYSFGGSLPTSIFLSFQSYKEPTTSKFALPPLDDSYVFSKSDLDNRTRRVRRTSTEFVSTHRRSPWYCSEARMSSFFSLPASLVISVWPLIRIRGYCKNCVVLTMLWVTIARRTWLSSTPAIRLVEIWSPFSKRPIVKSISSM